MGCPPSAIGVASLAPPGQLTKTCKTGQPFAIKISVLVLHVSDCVWSMMKRFALVALGSILSFCNCTKLTYPCRAVGGVTLRAGAMFLLTSRTSTAIDATGNGPLTSVIKVDDFSDFTVTIGLNVVVGVITFSVLLAAHEAYTSAGAKPLLANHKRSNNLTFQIAMLISWVILLMNSAMLIPPSLDFALAMGQSATASGLFVGGGTVFAVVGAAFGKSLTNESDWDQRFARRLFLFCRSLCLVLHVLTAFLLQSAVAWSLRTRQWTFWLACLLCSLNFGISAVPMVSWTTMWQIVTPPSDKTFWMILTQCGAGLRKMFEFHSI